MAKLLATREIVFATASELSKRGETITTQAIRKSIGGGSYTTIGRFLSEWSVLHSTHLPATQINVANVGSEMYLNDTLRRAESDLFRALENVRQLNKLSAELGFRLSSGVHGHSISPQQIEQWLVDASQHLAMMRLSVQIADRRIVLHPNEASSFRSDPIPYICNEFHLSRPLAEALWLAVKNKCTAHVRCACCEKTFTESFARVQDFSALMQASERSEWLCNTHNHSLWHKELRLSKWLETGLRSQVLLSQVDRDFLHSSGLIASTGLHLTLTSAGSRYLESPESFSPSVTIGVPCALSSCKKEKIIGEFFGDQALLEQEKARSETWCCSANHRAQLYLKSNRIDDTCRRLLEELQQQLSYDALRDRYDDLSFLIDRGLVEGTEGKKRRGTFVATKKGKAFLQTLPDSLLTKMPNVGADADFSARS